LKDTILKLWDEDHPVTLIHITEKKKKKKKEKRERKKKTK